jgi:hypothetical protein
MPTSSRDPEGDTLRIAEWTVAEPFNVNRVAGWRRRHPGAIMWLGARVQLVRDVSGGRSMRDGRTGAAVERCVTKPSAVLRNLHIASAIQSRQREDVPT